MQLLPSPNFDARLAGRPVDILVIHYTGMPTAADALARLTDPEAKVSAHYVIDEDGTLYRLVEEDKRAWHAGQSWWRGETDVNGRSIGIELVNPGHEFGYRPFPEPQIAALIALARRLLACHPIPARNVVGHSDVAPKRKMDPGELFPWARLAQLGIGLWPEEADEGEPGRDTVRAMLGDIGYETNDVTVSLRAFQRHFRPEQVDGRIDAETARRLSGLCALCRQV